MEDLSTLIRSEFGNEFVFELDKSYNFAVLLPEFALMIIQDVEGLASRAEVCLCCVVLCCVVCMCVCVCVCVCVLFVKLGSNTLRLFLAFPASPNQSKILLPNRPCNLQNNASPQNHS